MFEFSKAARVLAWRETGRDFVVIILLWALDVVHDSVVWIIVGALAIVAGLQEIMSGHCKCRDRT